MVALFRHGPEKRQLAFTSDRTETLALPLVILGFLLLHFALLPGHGLPAHTAFMSTGAVAESSHSQETAGADRDEPSHLIGQPQADADSGHQHKGDGPFCHADPNYAYVAPSRSGENEPDPGFWLLVTIIASAVGIVLAPRAQAVDHRRWSARPHWRPWGTELLTFACVART